MVIDEADEVAQLVSERDQKLEVELLLLKPGEVWVARYRHVPGRGKQAVSVHVQSFVFARVELKVDGLLHGRAGPLERLHAAC